MAITSPPERKITPFRRALPQILAVTIKNILLLGFGTTIGYPTILIGSLPSDPNFSLNKNEISWIGSLTYLCNPIGSILSGFVTQLIGRRKCMQLINVPYLIAWLFFYYSTRTWHLFLALGLIGFSGGLLEAPIITYVAEITEPSLRGALSSTSSISINLGILLAYILGTYLPWRTVALVNAAVPLAGFLLLLFVPESPYWLIATNQPTRARKSLAWLRGWTGHDEVEEEYSRLQSDLRKRPMKRIFKEKVYFKSHFLKPFFLILFISALSHFWSTPLNVYAIKIFGLLNVPISAYMATIYIGVGQLFAIIICTFSIKFIGKRVLTFVSLVGAFSCALITGTYSYVADATDFDQEANVNYPNWIPLAAMLGQAFFTYLCLKILPWILMGELFGNGIRGFGSGFSSATGYVCGFVANITFLDTVKLVTLPGLFWMHCIFALIGCVTLYFLLPETEGKTLEQITGHYEGGPKIDNKVYRETTTC